MNIPLAVVWTLALPSTTFSDQNNDTLTVTTSTLPSWLTFAKDAVSGLYTFTGTPTSPDTTIILVTADDGWSGTVTDTFSLVTGRGFPNQPPVPSTTIPD